MSDYTDEDDPLEFDLHNAGDVQSALSSKDQARESKVGEIKDLIRDHLDDIEGAREWASWASLSDGVNPGLSLKSSGIVGLPLSTQEALRIKQESGLERSGGDEPENSPDFLCELSTDAFELRNPAWQGYVQLVLAKAKEALGIHGEIQCELHNLELHDGTNPLKSEQCAKEAVGAVGTLVVYLPSLHDGGEIQTTFEGETKRFSPSSVSEFHQSYCAWYSDVNVVSDPILSGYRLQLTYKLYHTAFYERSYKEQSATSITARHKDFKLGLAQWNELWQQSGEPQLLAYMLDNNYSHDLNISALEQSDQHRAQFLKKHCVEEGFCLYLAQMESAVNDNENKTCELKRIVDLDGSVLLHDVDIDEERLIQADWFEDRDSVESDTQRYHDWYDESDCDRHFEDTVCLLMPAGQRLEFFIENTSNWDLKPWISWVVGLLGKIPTVSGDTTDDTPVTGDEADRSELARVCSHIIKKVFTWPGRTTDGPYENMNCGNHMDFQSGLQSIVQASLLLKDRTLFQDAMSVSPMKLTSPFYRFLGSILQTRNFDWYHEGLNQAIDQINSISDRYIALQSINSGCDCDGYVGPNIAALKDWSLAKMQEVLATVDLVEERDAKVLVDLGAQNVDLLIGKVFPLAMRHGYNLAFAAEFIACICEKQADAKISREIAIIGLLKVLATMIPAFSFGSAQMPAKRRRMDQTPTSKNDNQGEARWPLNGDRIAEVFSHCLSMGLKDEMDQLIVKLKQEAGRADSVALEQVLMPFLRNLPQVMRDQDIPLVTENYQELCKQVISLYGFRYVRREPERPPNWVCPKKGCGCKDCVHLDLFLISATRQTMEFTTTGPKRNHIEDRVRGLNEICKSTKKNDRAPHTLILTKTLDWWQSSHDAWSNRCSLALASINSIGIDNLKQLLGDRYDELIDLRQVKLVVPAVAAPWTSSSMGSQSNIIDLEED